MEIKNHWLTAPADTSTKSPNQGGVITPTIIVLHYTASGGKDGQGDADYLSRAASRASAQVVVGRNGSIDQIIAFNKRAWHAGVSEYNGKEDVNSFSIGIEIDNWGWLTDGKSHAGEVVPEEFRFKGTRSGHSEWEAYRDVQLAATEEVIAAICKNYNITDIVGHEDIAPGRKQDPGPALDEFKKQMKEKYVKKAAPTTAKPKPSAPKTGAVNTAKTTTAVNLRARPERNAIVLTVLPEGAEVIILKKNVFPGWDNVKFGNRPGFVANQYLD